MEGNYQEFRIFLSSPGDVKEERLAVKEVIQNVGRVCKEPLRLHFELIRWEDLTPMAASLEGESIQHSINQQIKRCHIFVLILNKRFGTVEEDFKESNTEREIKIALETRKYNKKIKFLAYFKDVPDNLDQGDQEKKVLELRKNLLDMGILYCLYTDTSSFKEVFTHHLYDTALRFRHSTFKVNALSTFWQLGTPERYTDRKLAILYPPMSFSYLKPVNPNSFWFKRLVPQVLFEDMMTLQKIEKTLRLISVSGFGFFPIDNPPPEINFMNRVWVCHARNKLSFRYFERYKKRAKFYFSSPQDQKEACLYWRYSTGTEGNDFIEIQSPLTTYLEQQRRNMKFKGQWKKEMGMVIAKDYAVLARLRDESNNIPMREGYFYDYFITGIRGLGTWGSAHFIDRNYPIFVDIDPSEDIQILLEVTYRDNRIFDVQNVSEKPEHYFQEQINPDYIRDQITLERTMTSI